MKYPWNILFLKSWLERADQFALTFSGEFGANRILVPTKSVLQLLIAIIYAILQSLELTETLQHDVLS